MNTRNLLIGFAAMSLFVACKGNDNQFDATGTFEATEVIVSSEATGRYLRLDITEGVDFKGRSPCGKYRFDAALFEKTAITDKQ